VLISKATILVVDGDPAVRRIASSVNLLAIQVLDIDCDDPSLLSRILQKCADSVETTILSCYAGKISEHMEDEGLVFPIMRFLQIHDYWSAHIRTQSVFSRSAPALQYHITNGAAAISSFDPGNCNGCVENHWNLLDSHQLSHYHRTTVSQVP